MWRPSGCLPATGNQLDDDLVGGVNNDPSAAALVPVTQESDDDIDVTNEVAHHIETHYSDDNDFEMFDSICGHDWDKGVLMLTLKWATDETSSLPFTVVKRDHPFETAQYILKHNVGTSDGRYSSGRYTRWACTYIHQSNRTLRCLLHMSGGVIECEDDVQDGLILPATLTSDGRTMLVRRGAISDASKGTP